MHCLSARIVGEDSHEPRAIHRRPSIAPIKCPKIELAMAA